MTTTGTTAVASFAAILPYVSSGSSGDAKTGTSAGTIASGSLVLDYDLSPLTSL